MGWILGFACGLVAGMVIGRQAAHDDITDWLDLEADGETISIEELKREMEQ